MNRLFRFLALALSGLQMFGPALVHGEAPSQVRLMRVYDGVASELLDVSADGQLLLARGWRTNDCPDRAKKCRKPVLAIYSTSSGKPLLEAVGREGGWFITGRFVSQQAASAIEVDWRQPPVRVVLDPSSLAEQRVPLATSREFRPQCILLNGGLLGVIASPETKRPTLAAARDNTVRQLTQPPLFMKGDLDCATQIREPLVLMESSAKQAGLYWISTDPKPPVRCSEFPGRLYNYAISPDGSVIVAVTGIGDPDRFDDDVMGPNYRTAIHVLAASTCAQLRTIDVVFPEEPKLKAPLLAPKNKYWANARLVSVFARNVAISPDNTKVAIGYGVRTDGIYSDSIAYFGIYSLQDGRRLATLRGDVFKNGWWETIRMFDAVPTRWAPVTGTLRFSNDGKSLFCSSHKLRQWDLSTLQ